MSRSSRTKSTDAGAYSEIEANGSNWRMGGSSWSLWAILLLPLMGCAHHTFAPGPGMSAMDFEPDGARCRLFARGSRSGFAVGAAGSPQFVASYTAGAALGGAIGSAVDENMNFNDCMQARGWRIVDGNQPVPGATLAGPVEQTPLALTVTPERRKLLIRATEVTPELAPTLHLSYPRGIEVLAVDPEGAASSAGLQPGDVILTFNGSPISGNNDMQREISRIAPGSSVIAGVWRNSLERAVSLKF